MIKFIMVVGIGFLVAQYVGAFALALYLFLCIEQGLK